MTRFVQLSLWLLLACSLSSQSKGQVIRQAVVGPQSVTANDVDAQFEKLLADEWEMRLQDSPTFATNVGDLRFNDRLGNATIEDTKKEQQQVIKLHQRLLKLDRSQLNSANQTHYDIFNHMLMDAIAEFPFDMHLIPITNRWGFHIWFPDLPRNTPFNTVKNYDDFISRLNDFGRYTDEHIDVMRVGMERGLTLPAVVMEGLDQTIAPHVVTDPEQSLLFKPLQKMPATFTDADRKRLTAEAKSAITKVVSPAFARFLKFMKTEYIPSCRGSIGASALPKGREYYRNRVKHFTTLDISPEQVHDIGQKEVRRIRKEMEAIIRKVKFDGDLPAFLEHLRTDPKFYATSKHQLMADVALIMKRMDAELPKLFKTLPRTPCGLREVPDYIAPKTTAAYYSRPTGDGTRPGIYFLNTFNLKSRPLYAMEALSFHEALPGHHLQLALQQELDLPNFRRFSGYTVFIEGWGLYSERLGLEVGFYEDPYSDFGRLTYEMWRACRLVVDTGIHYLGWTRQQAIEFMQKNSALSLHNITSEVDRYISWPGQALAYKIGELEIRKLRKQAESALGDDFDVREFHDVVLRDGSIPLSVLNTNVQRYIANTKKANR